jgi:drug/metabolite transporter (DMT)-like permease
MKHPKWLILSFFVPLLWGIWGALMEIPEKLIHPSFPSTLGYAVWALTMIPFALIAIRNAGWKLELDSRSLLYGCAVGFSGAMGQILLFWVLTKGPAYIIFPIICLSPVVTISLSAALLKERTYPLGVAGILFSIPAILLLSLQAPTNSPVHGYGWLLVTLAIFFAWGLQAYFIKSSASSVSSEGLFFYMAATGVALIPVALWMTDFSVPINWTITGPWLTASIQTLNSLGALLFVYAVRYGKAIIVVPMVNGMFPLVTILLSLLVYKQIPSHYNLAGMVLALVAIFLMAFDEVRHAPSPDASQVLQ